MANGVMLWMICLLSMGLSACGGVRSTQITQPEHVGMFREVKLLPPQVISGKQDSDTLSVNRELERLATDELRSLFKAKSIELSDTGKATVVCHINVDYGNRALRYVVGFGAGAGHITMKIDLKDENGVTRCSTLSEADLAIGVFGGNMVDVARNAISKGVKEFGNKL